MATLPYSGMLEVPALKITENKPLDVRTVVNNVEDLTNGSISNLYAGIVVNVKGTGDLYILTSAPRQASNPDNWKKVGSLPAGYVEKLEAIEMADIEKLQNLSKGVFPEFGENEDSDFTPGYATVEDVIDYVYSSLIQLNDYALKSELPTKVSDLSNDAGYLTQHQDLSDYATKNYVDNKITDLVGGAPETLDTLKEIADALQDNATMQMVSEAISTKANSADVYTKQDVDAKFDELPVEGSFPDVDGSEEKEFTPGLAKVEDVIDYVADAISDATPDLTPYATKEELPTKVSELANDSGYLTEHQDLSDYALKSELPVEGSFPEMDGSEYSDFVPGMATVEGVIDYVSEAIAQATPDLTPYATKEELPTKVSELENDVPYLTEHQDLSDYAEKDYVDVAIGSLDIPEHSEVLTTDGSMPTSRSGFSISNDAEGAFIEETYTDDGLHAGVYYSFHGINSTKDNGGSELDGVNFITLSNGGESWIKLYANGTMKFNLVDDSLGFNLENIVGIIDNNNNEYVAPYSGNPYGTPTMPLYDGIFIKFNVDVDFTGFTETRDDEPTVYIFGDTGSNYNDVDFYSIGVLPTVNAYVDGVSTRVLTEGDKEEILNKIEANEIEPISTEDIMDLF